MIRFGSGVQKMENEEKKELLNNEVKDEEREDVELLSEIEETVTAAYIGCVACC